MIERKDSKKTAFIGFRITEMTKRAIMGYVNEIGEGVSEFCERAVLNEIKKNDVNFERQQRAELRLKVMDKSVTKEINSYILSEAFFLKNFENLLKKMRDDDLEWNYVKEVIFNTFKSCVTDSIQNPKRLVDGVHKIVKKIFPHKVGSIKAMVKKHNAKVKELMNARKKHQTKLKRISKKLEIETPKIDVDKFIFPPSTGGGSRKSLYEIKKQKVVKNDA
ncbi:MAG: hypothetical protein KKC26_03770 [Nanoarchaeota archaeon]|nr:hypothetical protein [Nanoarchaeota archaeon]MBU1850535.1 hypothetical protein [Nanoarchaeota archaeon]